MQFVSNEKKWLLLNSTRSKKRVKTEGGFRYERSRICTSIKIVITMLLDIIEHFLF